MWVRFIFRATAVTLTLVIVGCNGGGELCSSEEVTRAPSPDGTVDAVVLLRNCGATVPDAYRVYVMEEGGVPDLDDETSVFVSDKTDGINVRWEADKRLRISYTKARIFHFKNFWQSKNVDNFSYIVSVTEVISESPTK
jgi:hypothetical protein